MNRSVVVLLSLSSGWCCFPLWCCFLCSHPFWLVPPLPTFLCLMLISSSLVGPKESLLWVVLLGVALLPHLFQWTGAALSVTPSFFGRSAAGRCFLRVLSFGVVLPLSMSNSGGAAVSLRGLGGGVAFIPLSFLGGAAVPRATPNPKRKANPKTKKEGLTRPRQANSIQPPKRATLREA